MGQVNEISDRIFPLFLPSSAPRWISPSLTPLNETSHWRETRSPKEVTDAAASRSFLFPICTGCPRGDEGWRREGILPSPTPRHASQTAWRRPWRWQTTCVAAAAEAFWNIIVTSSVAVCNETLIDASAAPTPLRSHSHSLRLSSFSFPRLFNVRERGGGRRERG